MVSEVYFAPLRARKRADSMPEKVTRLFRKAGLDRCIGKDDLVAIKTHFGEAGNTTFIQPLYLRKVVDAVKAAGGKPFLTDANTLYFGERANAVDHLCLAYRHGFLPSTVDAPVIIADGLLGKDFVEVEVNLRHFKTVKLGAAAVHAHALIAVSHFKGHVAAGFGGALKNLGMGFGSRGGKQMMHSEIKPEVDIEKCVGCGTCIRWCPQGAISLVNGKARIDPEICYGCAECFVTCTSRAIEIRWDTSSEALQEKYVEFAYGVLREKKGKVGFINFVIDVTPDCDCVSWSDTAFVPDIGVLASKDPVAIDQASAEMVNRAPANPNSRISSFSGADKLKALNDIDWTHQLRYAEEIGLGTRSYKLVEI
ncbi:MAG: DUF362 domain-containing protein [Candidatus Thermoplasmatota archaeon]